jgi:SM-20-related protein
MPPDPLNPPATGPDDEQLALLAASLHDAGWVVCDPLLPAGLAQALADDCRAAVAADALRAAAVGRGPGARHDPAVRGDRTLWLEHDPAHPARGALLDFLESLGRRLNRHLLLGIDHVEAHYAAYPPRAYYARHVDRFRDDDARVLSFTTYLNTDWHDADGGALRLHLPRGNVDVLPRLGTCTLFLSDQIEHEVLPARRERLSVAGWFRRRA